MSRCTSVSASSIELPTYLGVPPYEILLLEGSPISAGARAALLPPYPETFEVANRGVDGGSRPRQLCYPRGTFSVIPGPHQEGHRGSLGPAFAPASLGSELTVRPAYGLALHGGVLNRLSRPLGALDIFSRACRPSETAHLPLSPFRG